MRKIIIIAARTKEQATGWAKENKLSRQDWRYYIDKASLYGMTSSDTLEVEMVFVGEWYDNEKLVKDFKSIEIYCKMHNIKMEGDTPL